MNYIATTYHTRARALTYERLYYTQVSELWGFNPGCVPAYVWEQSEKWKRIRNWLHNYQPYVPIDVALNWWVRPTSGIPP